MGEGKRLFIVDDEMESSENIAEFFGRLGYDVTLTHGGKPAIEILEKISFPVVLLDIKMPDLDGEEVLKFIMKKDPDTKVIMVTGFSEGKSREDFIEMGACDYIMKPIDLAKMYDMLNKMYE